MAFLASAACSLSSSALQSANIRATVMYTITKFPIHFDLASSAVDFGVAGGSSGGGGASADAGTFVLRLVLLFLVLPVAVFVVVD